MRAYINEDIIRLKLPNLDLKLGGRWLRDQCRWKEVVVWAMKADLTAYVLDLKTNVLDISGLGTPPEMKKITRILQICWKSMENDLTTAIMSFSGIRRHRNRKDDRWRWWIVVAGWWRRCCIVSGVRWWWML
ncbi:unnamed protein product [Lactuca virosa]|uniref:Uncharacterized protein n=1 Tax=Lactuca virosa TaxID=75947 RepID=A0AAU9NEH6_9ASTR|nr:unnamed protein product [Lactuca virosa]